VTAALQDAFGIRNDDVFKAATALAGGGGGTIDGSCGAYSGSIMVMSWLRGRVRDSFSDQNSMQKAFLLANKLHEKFIQEYGSVLCRDVQTKVFGRPFYLADPEEFSKFEKAGAHDIHCPEVVGKAAQWAAEIILEAGLVPKKD
jgi:C_GCAxxG_C_C family probable redox protein